MKVYLAIDLKSFYASVECIERCLDPLDINLVVADQTRTDKTICLAVTPALKSFGIGSRPRLFMVQEQIKQLNRQRQKLAPNRRFVNKSVSLKELTKNTYSAIDYLVVPPRMQMYVDYSARIYEVYLKYISPEDIHVYSIDEVFIDASKYLHHYHNNSYCFAEKIVKDIIQTTGITATVGIGSNLFLAKVAMDILAKKANPDEHGIRIAYLDEASYREKLWYHQPLTDFWRIGRGISQRLEKLGLHTMADIAQCALAKDDQAINAKRLFKEFGVQAELLIDHAFGIETCTMEAIKNYQAKNHSISSSQVLFRAYEVGEAYLIVKEMTENLSNQLVQEGLVTTHLSISLRYQSLENQAQQPKGAKGTIALSAATQSYKELVHAASQLFTQIVQPNVYIRRISIHFHEVFPKKEQQKYQQLSLFVNEDQADYATAKKEENLTQTLLTVRRRYGKNSVLRASSLLDFSTARLRNNQIGGHKK